jgi:hypothetical protein
MMGATISLGIQNVLLDVSAWWAIQALVCVLACWLLIRVWYPGQGPDFHRALLQRALLLLLFLRFAVPVMLIANDLLYQQFLEQRYQQSTQIISRAGNELEQLQAQPDIEKPGDDDAGILDSITRAWSDTVDSIDLSGKLERMQAAASEVIEHLVQLSVVFILQTGLLPVAFLWCFLEVLKRLFKSVRRKEFQA